MLRVVEHLRQGAHGLPDRGDRLDTLRWKQCAAEMNQSCDGEHRCGDDEHVGEESACHDVDGSD